MELNTSQSYFDLTPREKRNIERQHKLYEQNSFEEVKGWAAEGFISVYAVGGNRSDDEYQDRAVVHIAIFRGQTLVHEGDVFLPYTDNPKVVYLTRGNVNDLGPYVPLMVRAISRKLYMSYLRDEQRLKWAFVGLKAKSGDDKCTQ